MNKISLRTSLKFLHYRLAHRAAHAIPGSSPTTCASMYEADKKSAGVALEVNLRNILLEDEEA